MKTMWLVAIILSSIGLALPSTPAAAQTSAGSQAAASQRSASRKKKVKKYDPAVLVVVTNFGKADVKVNGLAYPEYAGQSAEPGMVVPAGGPYRVEVTYNGNTRVYTIYLKANETRYLMVDLTGFSGGNAVAAPIEPPAPVAPPKEELNSEQGRVTVYSKPAGKIVVDGKVTEEASPGTVEVDPGRHEISVRFESGTDSERKVVRVRKGSRIKLFFRDQTAGADE